ncbi:MAG: hypothetical protein KAR39_00270 [Thermoplasmata archaeon]|nr:hypothetical protein [Thermoplasmata archaeon]
MREEVDFELLGGPIQAGFGIEVALSNITVIDGGSTELFIDASPRSAYVRFDFWGLSFSVPISETPLGTYSHRFTGFSIPFVGDIEVFVDITGYLIAEIDGTGLEGSLIVNPLDHRWDDWGLKATTCRVKDGAHGSDTSGILDVSFEYRVKIGISVQVPVAGRITVGEVSLTSLSGSPSLNPVVFASLRPSPVSLDIAKIGSHRVTLEWGRSSDPGFSFYEIESLGGTISEVLRIRSRDYSRLEVSVKPDSDYSFTITVEDSDFLRSPSQSMNVHTPLDPPPEPVILSPPSESDLGPTHIPIQWSFTHANDFNRYEVVVNGEVASIIRVETHNTSTLKGLQPETAYEILVVTYDTWGNSASSIPLAVQTHPQEILVVTTEVSSVVDTNWALILFLGFLGGILSYPTGVVFYILIVRLKEFLK